MTPTVIQLRRTKGWRHHEGTVRVDRQTIWGNPWQVGDPGRWWWPHEGGKAGWEVEMLFDHPINPALAVGFFTVWLREGFLPRFPAQLTDNGRSALARSMSVRRRLILDRLPELRGKPLGCRFAPGQPCHAHVLITLANQEPVT